MAATHTKNKTFFVGCIFDRFSQKKSVNGSAALGRDTNGTNTQNLLHLCNSMCIDIIHCCNMFNYLCVGMKVNVFFPFFPK